MITDSTTWTYSWKALILYFYREFGKNCKIFGLIWSKKDLDVENGY